ncbi:MAG: hypothetical protein Q9199_002257 [Rusavskia elegans]
MELRVSSFTHIKVTKMGPRELDLITEVMDTHPQIVNGLVEVFDREYFMRIWSKRPSSTIMWGKLPEGVRFRNQLPTMAYDIR